MSAVKAIDQMLSDQARQGNAVEVMRLLKAGADACADHGAALCLAAAEGHIEVVQCLLDEGVTRDTTLSQDLVEAAGGGHDDIVTLLLGHGRDVNAHSGEALLRAVLGNHLSTVKLLLAHGAKPESWPGEPLSSAVRSGCFAIVSLLLGKGVKVLPYLPELFEASVVGGSVDVLQELVGALQRETQTARKDLGSFGQTLLILYAQSSIRQILRRKAPRLLARGLESWVTRRCLASACRQGVRAAIQMGSAEQAQRVLRVLSPVGQRRIAEFAIQGIYLSSRLPAASKICGALRELAAAAPVLEPTIIRWIDRETKQLFRDDWPEREHSQVAIAWSHLQKLGRECNLNMPAAPVWLMACGI